MFKEFKDKYYQQELKREIKLLIIVTIGFTIAFSWRQTTFDASISIVQWLFKIQGEVASSIAASLLITIIGIVIILLTSKYLKDIY